MRFPILVKASVPLSRKVCNVLGLTRSFLHTEWLSIHCQFPFGHGYCRGFPSSARSNPAWLKFPRMSFLKTDNFHCFRYLDYTLSSILAAKVKPDHSLHPTLPTSGILWHSWRKTEACFLVFNAKKSRNNHTTMDLQTTDGLLHQLSSCCIISGIM